MAKTHVPYAPEFRRQMVELVRAGRDPADLAREFEPSSQAIRNWVAQADRQEGRRGGNACGAATSQALTRPRKRGNFHFNVDAIELLAGRLRTALQIEMHLTLAFEHAFRLGEKRVSTEIVEQVLSRAIDELGPTLTRRVLVPAR